MTHALIFRDDPSHSFTIHVPYSSVINHCELFLSQAGYFHWFCLLTASRSWNQLQHPLFFLGTSCATLPPEILKLYHSINFLVSVFPNQIRNFKLIRYTVFIFSQPNKNHNKNHNFFTIISKRT